MTEVLLIHHVQGLTDGVRALAAQLRAEGHTVHTPDLFDGEQPATVDAGTSWGAATAQRLAQTRTGARGALLYESCVPITGDWAFGPWPAGVPVRIHGMDQDPYFALEGDLDAARELVASVGPELAALFVYPGDRHLFTDSSLPSYDADAATLVVERSKEFLARLG